MNSIVNDLQLDPNWKAKAKFSPLLICCICGKNDL